VGGNPAAAQRRKQEAARAQLLYLGALVIGMVGLSYAAVPLYRMFCQATGFGGTTQRKEVSQRCAEVSPVPGGWTAVSSHEGH